MAKPIVLIVDDEYRSFQSLPRLVSHDAFSAVWVPNEHEGLKVLREQPQKVSIVVIDLKSSGMGGGGFLHQARQIAPKAAIMVTGPLGPFLYQGGNFYEFSGPSLKQDINAILFGIAQKMGIVCEPKKKETKQSKNKEQFGIIIGRSRSVNKIYRLIENLKDSSATVLIHGESGVGKEIVAQTIHQTSPRKNQPFVAINCGAIPASLMESELFGHERGAFTTAIRQRKGKFEVAYGGTLFLDEIGELGRDLQVKLLRVLQEKEFQRVGGNRTYKTDVRIIAASTHDLKKVVQAGHFRDDLFYRLNVVPIHIPPLRERREDVPLLIEHFFQRNAQEMGRPIPSLSEEAREALFCFSYPGNVRELINIVERLFVTCPNGEITLQDLPGEVRQEAKEISGATEILRGLPEGGVRLQDVEKELILKTMQKASGNKQAAAKMMGITRRLLYLRLSQYGLNSRDTMSQ